MREPVSRPSDWWSALRAVTDEGVLGLSHLLVHWHLARTLEPARYGAFALAMVWGLLGASVHQAFLVEPLLVASASPLSREPGHLRALLGWHWRLTLPVALSVALAAAWLGNASDMAHELAAAGAFALGVSLIRLVRGMAYAALPARVGTLAVASYASFTTLGLGLLAYFQASSGALALLVMGFSGALGGTLVLLRAGLAAPTAALRARVLRYHWQHGRWLVLLSPLRWALDSVPLVILGSVSGLADVARLRVALIVVAPAVQVVGALRMMLIPRFALAARSGQLARLLWRNQLVLLATCGAFFVIVSSAARPILRLFSSSYADAAGLLPIVALTPLLLGSALLFGNALRALGRSDLSAWAFALASAASALAGLGLCSRYGSLGAALALACGYAALLMAKGWLALSTSRSQAPSRE
jgi:O-antigen/teichoic acid export membrane protein